MAMPIVIDYAAEYLRITALNFIATGIILAGSGALQGLGNVWPALIASGTRLVTFVFPAPWLCRRC
jgi:Na+-driven multidrug efflux pump